MSYTPTSPIVRKLVQYFSENPDFKADFEASFLAAKSYDLDIFKTYNIQSVDDYLRFMDDYVHWVPTEDVSGTTVYYHICVFYFILDLLPVYSYQSPIHPSSQSPWTWLSQWLIEYAVEMGTWMDTSESITEDTIQTFVDSPAYRDPDITTFYDQYPPPTNGWQTFNEFFSRQINPDCRPLPIPEDPTAIVSPADCKFDGQWPVREDGTVDFDDTFVVKGVPWSINQLVDFDPSFMDAFAGGLFTHSFLSPTDYHRQHAPVAGRVLEAKVIQGLCYLEIALEESNDGSGKPRLRMHRKIQPKTRDSAIIPSDDIGAPDSPGYQFLQARGFILIDSAIGLVAVLPIGMAQEISRFQLGGSDIVMVFQKEANVQLNQEMDTHYKVRSQIGTAQLVTVTN